MITTSKLLPCDQPNYHRCSNFQFLHTCSAPQKDLHKNPDDTKNHVIAARKQEYNSNKTNSQGGFDSWVLRNVENEFPSDKKGA